MALINGTNNSDAGLAPFPALIGTQFADTINGKIGDDELFGRNGNDLLNGGDGNDFCKGEGGNDTVNGGAGDDTLDGGSGKDTLNGGVGNDLMRGGSGNDKLVGGAGGDHLNGGTGKDILDGGNEAVVFGVIQDNFDFNSTSDSNFFNRDRVLNFNFGDEISGDKIDVATIDAIAGTPVNDTFVFVAAPSGSAGELWVENDPLGSSDSIINGDVNGDGFGDLQIAVNDGGTDAGFWVGELDFFL